MFLCVSTFLQIFFRDRRLIIVPMKLILLLCKSSNILSEHWNKTNIFDKCFMSVLIISNHESPWIYYDGLERSTSQEVFFFISRGMFFYFSQNIILFKWGKTFYFPGKAIYFSRNFFYFSVSTLFFLGEYCFFFIKFNFISLGIFFSGEIFLFEIMQICGLASVHM